MSEGKPINLLLVEDDEIDVLTVRRAFEKGKILNPLFVAGDGVEALAKLRGDELPKGRLLVLLDLNLPRMNGIELLREIRGDPDLRSLPVVVLTTSNEEKDKVEAFGLHVAGYLLKPVTFTKFVSVMAAIDRYWTLVELPTQ